MNVSFDGIGEKIVTFEAASGVEAGAMVKMSGAGTVAACAAKNDVPIGKVLQVRGGICAVQTAGYMKLPCASGTVVGFGLFALGEDKKLASGTSGRPGFVVDVDSTAGECGVMF